MKKPSKTAAELEASIKVEMEDICDEPTDMPFSVQPDGDSWVVRVLQEGNVDDAERRDMLERIAARLNADGLVVALPLTNSQSYERLRVTAISVSAAASAMVLSGGQEDPPREGDY
jgi:hypothetical protein